MHCAEKKRVLECVERSQKYLTCIAPKKKKKKSGIELRRECWRGSPKLPLYRSWEVESQSNPVSFAKRSGEPNLSAESEGFETQNPPEIFGQEGKDCERANGSPETL
jgi:hypothetical protein